MKKLISICLLVGITGLAYGQLEKLVCTDFEFKTEGSVFSSTEGHILMDVDSCTIIVFSFLNAVQIEVSSKLGEYEYFNFTWELHPILDPTVSITVDKGYELTYNCEEGLLMINPVTKEIGWTKDGFKFEAKSYIANYKSPGK